MDDCFSRELFDRMIASQGGEIAIKDIGSLLKSEERDRHERALSGWYVDDTTPADFQDSLGREGLREHHPWVRALVNIAPEIMGRNTHAAIPEAMARLGFTVVSSAAAFQGDTTEDAVKEQAQAYEKVHELTRLRLAGRPYKQEDYAKTIKSFWKEAYTQAHVAIGTELKQIIDLTTLKRLNRVLAHIEAQERSRHGAH
jgi:hypothetical protein